MITIMITIVIMKSNDKNNYLLPKILTAIMIGIGDSYSDNDNENNNNNFNRGL